ncbi:related to phospholipase a-2-activating protein [Rhynchosporium graminicola]|uniref:Related to phospholipase a-2-activating protein n=1 Tax=Rhynchosporium graminicola TaxID=2792576 RepID=A0A1E1LIV4_9HELO|nr:related to phospholipase a-2-activating protein [Rhynchosporium commune]
MAEYKISATLAEHEDDVRGVAFPSPKAVLSASRDGTVRLWKHLSANPPLFDGTISSHAGSWMNTVAFLPPSPDFPEGLIIASGKDVVIDVRQPTKAAEEDAEALLLGHSRDVCALDVDPAGKYIVSGSWDHDARVFPVGKWECSAVLSGHEGTVWAVLAYDVDTIVTGCADQKIRIFTKAGKLLKVFQGGNSPVRALCRLPQGHPSGGDFASADNDGAIRLWTVSGKNVGELLGHESFIYSLAALPSGELVSSGEDRTMRIWKGNQCIQTITHPAISVWAVAVCAENGDIVSGASDRIVRVFTRDPARYANAENTALFEDAVKASSIPQQTLDVNKENMPGPEFLTQKSGTKDGQIVTIRELDGSVTAHSWSSGQGEWTLVGTVVDAVGSSNKKTEYKGQEYDFVFDVDMEDGKPPLKLPYNVSQNPYDAATKFIQDNEAPITYLEQVANFIIQNTQGATIGQSQPQQTGAGSDPWGSENRYRPGSDQPSAPTPNAPPKKSLPQKEYLSILNGRIPPIQKKLAELSQALVASGKKELGIFPNEISTLDALCKHLEAPGANTTSVSFEDSLELIVKLVTKWPYTDRLPGLDLLRLMIVAPETAEFDHPGGNVVTLLLVGAFEAKPPAENHVMMATRAFANLFASPEGRALAGVEFDRIQAVLSIAVVSSKNRNLLVAVATVYINYAVLFLEDKDAANFEHALGIVDMLAQILTSHNDAEIVFRSLVAVGTVICLGEEIKSAAKDVYGIEKCIATAVSKAIDPRIKTAAKEVEELLK